MKANSKLYEQAREAYYNGQEIMSDLEFDELERSLGLDNSLVGARHNPSYTVQHPYIMGSLRKVQVHSKDGKINWNKYLKEVDNFTRFENGVIISPKYDGCSFEILFKNNEVVKASTRGDGYYGKDVTNIILHLFKRDNIVIDCKRNNKSGLWVLRGEFLLQKEVFLNKYFEDFKNPRAFVSGTINSDWTETKEYIDRVNDLDYVVYEYRINTHGDFWLDKDFPVIAKMAPSLQGHMPKLYFVRVGVDNKIFKHIYYRMKEYRDNGPYPLDGFVVKPLDIFRIKTPAEYPADCVAVKFEPQVQTTVVENIEWKLGKTVEYNPVVVVKPVIMDGKTINRASAHNYGYLVDNKVSIGTELVLSLAGDIIPFIYKVTDTSKYSIDKLNLPENTKVKGCHLMAKLGKDERRKVKFIYSVTTLNIPSIGEKTAWELWKPKYYNILQMKSEEVEEILGGQKGKNAADGLRKVVSTLTLSEVIQSLNFRSCGEKVANQIENYLLGLPYDFSHLPAKAYVWAYDSDSKKSLKLRSLLQYIGKHISDFSKEIDTGKIPVILTGKPSKYKTKGDFLKANPEYRETSSWKEAKILFTGDMNSTSSKMTKAKSAGIDIQIY